MFITIIFFGRKSYCSKIISTINFLDHNDIENKIVSLNIDARSSTILEIDKFNKTFRISFKGNDNSRFEEVVENGDIFKKNKNSNIVTLKKMNGDEYSFNINRQESCKNVSLINFKKLLKSSNYEENN